jgi:hypothetical protein
METVLYPRLSDFKSSEAGQERHGGVGAPHHPPLGAERPGQPNYRGILGLGRVAR